MTTYGYGQNKGKHEVYTKEEAVGKNDIVVLRGKLDFVMEGTSASGSKEIDFPEGFTHDNCFVLSFGVKNLDRTPSGYAFGVDATDFNTVSVPRGTIGKSVYFHEGNNKIVLKMQTSVTSEFTTSSTNHFDYKLVLMKHEVSDSEYTLGDVNQDGQITQEDKDILDDHILNGTALTAQQFKAADINKDGYIDTGDAYKLQQYLANGTPLE